MTVVSIFKPGRSKSRCPSLRGGGLLLPTLHLIPPQGSALWRLREVHESCSDLRDSALNFHQRKFRNPRKLWRNESFCQVKVDAKEIHRTKVIPGSEEVPSPTILRNDEFKPWMKCSILTLLHAESTVSVILLVNDHSPEYRMLKINHSIVF
ncbi:hypothetical protein CEXT_369551 [Caerostris extrusa]|uniref:Uncharacterized protein n=1 Tax=Caerostris extrusa TaxID=172846 RepID=A0AAV4STJ9_CAEEX|nr:hypothetical protein CEXT_369551 [Caerostris extrusa]